MLIDKLLRCKSLAGKFFLCWKRHGFKESLVRCLSFICRNKIFRNNALLFKSGTVELVPGIRRGKPAAVAKAKSLLRADLSHAVSIAGKYTCLYGKDTDFSATPAVIVAHLDPQQIVDPYVEYMCKHFKSLGWKVVLSSAAPLQQNDVLERWSHWADAIVCRNCDGYDFTSWKAALDCFPSLYHSKFLVLCNDSCFGPVGSFAPVHERMKNIPCDFWGLTFSRMLAPHLQSFYLVLREKALRHKALKEFFDAVPLDNSREKAITFELSFTLWLGIHGLCPGIYQGVRWDFLCQLNPSLHFWDRLLDNGVPLMKREKFRSSPQDGIPTGWNVKLADKKYPLELIANYFWRIGEDISGTQCPGTRYSSFPPDVFSLQQSVDLTAAKDVNHSLSFAVIIHVFYIDVFESLMSFIKNIPQYGHIYVSTDTEEKKEKIIFLLNHLNFDKIEVRIFPNVGYDIASFVVGFKDVIKDYPLLLKIHTKKSTNCECNFGKSWRELLYSSLLGSPERVRCILAYFEKNSQLGLIAPVTKAEVVTVAQGDNNHVHMRNILARKGITLPRDVAIDFPVGGMFWARTEILKPWQDLGFTFDNFENTQTSPRDGTLAHAFERLFVWGCGIKGMTWGRVAPVGYDVLRCSQEQKNTTRIN